MPRKSLEGRRLVGQAAISPNPAGTLCNQHWRPRTTTLNKPHASHSAYEAMCQLRSIAAFPVDEIRSRYDEQHQRKERRRQLTASEQNAMAPANHPQATLAHGYTQPSTSLFVWLLNVELQDQTATTPPHTTNGDYTSRSPDRQFRESDQHPTQAPNK
jgi:hypothetical protein